MRATGRAPPRRVALRCSGSGNKVKTSQLALPVDACNAAYATTGYSASVTGSADAGYVATLTVGIPASPHLSCLSPSVPGGRRYHPPSCTWM